MARTFHHRGYDAGRFPDGSPPSYRRWLNQRYRARMRQLMRERRYDVIYQPKRDAGWYW
jgi:hypothetical protein